MFDCDYKTFREFSGLFLLRAVRGSEPCVSLVGGMTQLTLRSLNLGLYFCVDFPSSSELIGYVDLTDSYDIWPKCSLVINAQKCVRLFWYSKYFPFYALSINEDPQIFNSPTSIDFLGNQSGYRKSLTHFCSQSPTDLHCAVCLVARASRKAGNSV